MGRNADYMLADDESLVRNDTPSWGSKPILESPNRDLPDPDELRYQEDGADPEVYEEPLPKRRRCYGRKNHDSKVRRISLQELEGRRGSKHGEMPDDAQSDSSQRRIGHANPKPRKKKKQSRRLPVDELALVSERINAPDLEVDDGQSPIYTPN